MSNGVFDHRLPTSAVSLVFSESERKPNVGLVTVSFYAADTFIIITSRGFIAEYIGEDCSLAADAVPVISSFRRGCTCDVRHFRCSRVFVRGTDIHDALNLTCHVQSADSVSLCNDIRRY